MPQAQHRSATEEAASRAEAARLETASLRESLLQITGRLEETEKELEELEQKAAGAEGLEIALAEARERGNTLEERLAQQVDTTAMFVLFVLCCLPCFLFLFFCFEVDFISRG